jgi:hypothetical protein
LREHVSKIGPEDLEKINLINSIAERYIDFDAIDAKISAGSGIPAARKAESA